MTEAFDYAAGVMAGNAIGFARVRGALMMLVLIEYVKCSKWYERARSLSLCPPSLLEDVPQTNREKKKKCGQMGLPIASLGWSDKLVRVYESTGEECCSHTHLSTCFFCPGIGQLCRG